MASIVINISDAAVTRISNTIDTFWPGREAQDPIPTKLNWLKFNLIKILKTQVIIIEKEAQIIEEIEIN